MKKKCLHGIVFIFLCLSIYIYMYQTCSAEDHSDRTVRVAYFDLGSYYQVMQDGAVRSFDAAYLSQLSKYTDFEFEYVDCGTWENAIQMLSEHKVDLVGTMQWTQEREDHFEICDASYGYTVAELAAKENSDFIYEDYDRINGLTVGYIEGYVIGDKLGDYAKEKGITFNIRTYGTQSELDNALESGQIDLVAANAHAIHDNWRIVEKFDYAPFYFASWKGNDALTEALSSGIIQINLHESGFDDALIKEYFPVMVNSPYNKEEIDCIQKHDELTIYFDANTKPLVWYDSDSKSMQGVLINVCEQIRNVTGLDLNMRTKSAMQEDENATAVSYRTLYYENGNQAKKETGVTDSILDQEFELYHRLGSNYQPNGSYFIGVVKNRDGLYDYIADKYPEYTIIEYETPEDCVKGLASGKVDLAFLNTYVAENVMIEGDYNEVSAIPMSQVTFGIALKFTGEEAELLAGIVNKGVKLIDEDSVNDALLKYAMDTSPKFTLSYLLRQHTALFLTIVLVVILIMLTCAGLGVYAVMMKKERNRMEEINTERTDFFARMSHDMRTPMNGILGMLELTEESDDIEEIKNNTRKAELSGKYMLSLINDTLDLQRLESNKLTLEPQFVYVRDFIDNIKEMIQPSAKQKHINFIVNNRNVVQEYYINIDPVRVKQIFVNILSNAVKFTPENGTIETSIENQILDGNKAFVRVVISDTGIGMSKEFIENNLFKPYSQEHNKVTNRYAGSGLGLAIVKNLVEMMNGHIEVRSELGEGTTFVIDLEFEYIDKHVVQDDLKSKHDNIEEIKATLKHKHILICEDHPLNAEIAKKLLEKIGCTSVIAQDGRQGLEIYSQSEKNEFDCILMDIRMPFMDGLEAAAAIRSLDREDAKQIPIIAMTANAYDSDKENCKKAGMNAHIAKPIDVNEMYITIDRCIRKKE